MTHREAMRPDNGRRGRPSTRRLADELAVLGALGGDGARLSLDALCEYLCMDELQARKLVEILSCSSAADATQDAGPLASLYLADEGAGINWARAGSSGAWPGLRLTEPQAQAVERAFDLLGVGVNNDLRTRCARAFYPPSMSPAPTGERPIEPGAAAGVIVCALSLARAQEADEEASVSQPVVIFTYRGTNDSVIARGRRVVPRLIRIDQGRWLVDAFDLDARATRTFFASQMESCSCTREERVVPAGRVERPDGGCVRLRCHGAGRAAVQAWEGAQVVSQDGDALVIDVPYYRGEWLPRHVLALGALVEHDSPELAREIAEVAREDLDRAAALSARARSATSR